VKLACDGEKGGVPARGNGSRSSWSLTGSRTTLPASSYSSQACASEPPTLAAAALAARSGVKGSSPKYDWWCASKWKVDDPGVAGAYSEKPDSLRAGLGGGRGEVWMRSSRALRAWTDAGRVAHACAFVAGASRPLVGRAAEPVVDRAASAGMWDGEAGRRGRVLRVSLSQDAHSSSSTLREEHAPDLELGQTSPSRRTGGPPMRTRGEGRRARELRGGTLRSSTVSGWSARGLASSTRSLVVRDEVRGADLEPWGRRARLSSSAINTDSSRRVPGRMQRTSTQRSMHASLTKTTFIPRE